MSVALHYDIKWKQEPAESLCLPVWCSLASLAPDKIQYLPGHTTKTFEATGPLNPTTIGCEWWLHLGHFWERITDGQTTKPFEHQYIRYLCCNSEPQLTSNVMGKLAVDWTQLPSTLQVPRLSTMLLCILLKHSKYLQYIAKQSSDLLGVQTNK